MNEILPATTRPKKALVKNVRRVKLGACLNQLRNFVSGVLCLLKNPSPVFALVQDGHSDVVIVRPQLIVDIDEVADKSSGAKFGASIQGKVKGLPVRAIDNRDLLGDPNEGLSAVSALLGVSLQRITAFTTPLIAETVTERSAVREEGRSQTSDVRSPTRVPKYPFPATSQLYETAGAAKTAFGVRKRVDFRTGVAH